MPRKITTASDAAGEPAAPEQTETAQAEAETREDGAVTFVKNVHPAEPLALQDGTTFTFPATSFTTSDTALIRELTRLAGEGNHFILIQ